jgi:hypothetical protein
MVFPEAGTGSQGSELDMILADNLSGMGDFIASDIGSLAWCEAYANARLFDATLSFVRLLAAQSEPAQASIFLDYWRTVFLNAPAGSDTQLLQYIQELTLQIGTPPTYSNVFSFLQSKLGNIFLTLEWRPLYGPSYVTFVPPTGTELWQSPISDIMVHCYQPRDNLDNILLPYSVWLPILNSWQNIVENWIPANAYIYDIVPANAGGNGGSGGNANLYGGYNSLITLTAGSNVVTGVTNCSFDIDFTSVYSGDMVGQLLEIVDDANVVRTYYVGEVSSMSMMNLTAPAVSNATSRTFRTLGIQASITPIGPSHVCN